MSASNLSLVVRPSSFVHRLTSPLWPQNPTMNPPQNHLFSPLLEFQAFVFWSFKFASDFVLRISDLPFSLVFRLSLVVRPPSSVLRLPSFALRPSLFVPTPKVKKCKKSAQNMLKTRSFLTKKCKKSLIFTPIFRLKTNKSYKITLFTTASHPIFQNFSQNPLFS